MLLFDVNVPVGAFMESSPHHAGLRRWLEDLLDAHEPFGLSEPVLSSFVRIVTIPSFPGGAVSTGSAVGFASIIRDNGSARRIVPGPRHWDIFRRLCEGPDIRGNLVPDAYLAALAIEHGLEFVTTDADFARFPGLRWRHPLRAG